jgi:hypothetical protein
VLLQLGVVCEVNTVFLHLRKLLNLVKCPPSHAVYRYTWAGVWATLVLFRLAPHSWILWTVGSQFQAISDASGAGDGLVAATGLAFALFLAFDIALTMDVWNAWKRDRKTE